MPTTSRGPTRTALVTGANRGIGEAIARELAAAGLRVVLGVRSPADGEAVAASITANGGQARVIGLDVAVSASIEHAVAELQREGIAIDVLVNNAGVYRKGACLGVPLEAVRESLEVHLLGPLALCQALVPGMMQRGYGRVVNVSSGYGSFSEGLQGDAAYSISKAALNALTLKLAGEVRGDVKVNAACPGWVRTRMGGQNADRSVEEGADTIVWLATLPAGGPSGGIFRDRKPIAW
jgi:NAD(P)-dependent dehydrogenase (short-subunit alcohol dehydrogenase family)